MGARVGVGVRTRDVAVITGGSRGLGLEMARQLVRRGDRVVLLARDAARLDRALARIAKGSGEPSSVSARTCDVADPEQCRSVIARVVADHGRLDRLVNNAGTIAPAPFPGFEDRDLAEALDVHLWGPLNLIRAALPHLRESPRARIVNVSAIEGKVGLPGLAATGASKAALCALTESLRSDLGRDGVRVTLAIPGFIRPPAATTPEEAGASSRSPLWRIPGISISRTRAARRILAASDRGAATVILTPAARLLMVWSALAPESLAWIAERAGKRL